MRHLPLLLAALAVSACAQTSPPPAAASAPAADADQTDTEAAVAALVAQPGVHVVHLWAPWCGNSRAGLESGWYETIAAHPDVSFSFVTIWNDGDDAADRLARYGIEAGANVGVFAQPDRGRSADRSLRRTTFLGLPLSWTPTTWVFNRDGKLAFAINYGEVSAEMLESLIESAQSDWMHD